MHVAARARLVLARRPWAYWVVVATLAALAAAAVHGEMASIAAERDRWGSTRTVLVARHRLEPGDPIAADHVALPIAAIPDEALAQAPSGALVRQRVAVGEVLTALDVTGRSGPAALAEPGTVVVALSDPLARDVAAGLHVQVVADGLVIADRARVTGVVDDVIYVAVVSDRAPAVAAAAQTGDASLLYVP
jgi:hypothetical protein